MRSLIFLVLTVLALTSCTPRLNWREVQGNNAPYTVLMPAKPSRFTRPVNLDGVQAHMTMTAAEIGGLTFAVGSAQLQDSTQVPHALDAMKRAMVSNIHGTIRSTNDSADGQVEAVGDANGKPAVLHARFIGQGQWVYQVVLLARDEPVAPEMLDTFFGSFKTR